MGEMVAANAAPTIPVELPQPEISISPPAPEPAHFDEQNAPIITRTAAEILRDETPPLRELRKPDATTIQAEAEMIAGTTLQKKYTERRKGKKEADPRTPEEEAMNTILFFKNHLEKPDAQFSNPILIKNDEGAPLRLRATQEGGIAVKGRGQELTAILEKKVVKGQVFFMCELAGMDKPVPVHASELIKAQYFEEGTAIVQAIDNPEQKKIVAEYIIALEHPDQDIALSPTDIEAAAKKTGFISSEAAYGLISGAELSASEKEELLSILDGSTVASPEALGKILYKMNQFETSFASKKAQAEDLEQTIKQIEKNIASVTEGSDMYHALIAQKDELTVKLNHLNAELPSLEQLAEASKISEADYIALIKGLYEAEGNEDSIAKLEQAMKEANLKELLQNLLGVVPKDSKDYEKYQKMIENALQYGGIALMAMVAIMVMQGMRN